MKFTIKEIRNRADKFDAVVLTFFVYVFSFILCSTIAMVAKEFFPKYADIFTTAAWSGFWLFIAVGIAFLFYIKREKIKKDRENDRLMIGMVRCKKCCLMWEALAMESDLNDLECPKCNARDSAPLKNGGENEKKQKGSF